jgi:hypothetical protein
LIAVIGLGQADPGEQLQQLLLTQEELIEELGDDAWVVKTIDRLNPEPEGALGTAVATYVNTNTLIALVTGLIDFEATDFLDRFLGRLLEARQVIGSRDLLEEAQENPDILPELLQQETSRVLLLSLEDDQQQLVLQRNTLLAFLRISQVEGASTSVNKEELLLQVAARQLQKVLDFCESLEGEQPAYCPPPAR